MRNNKDINELKTEIIERQYKINKNDMMKILKNNPNKLINLINNESGFNSKNIEFGETKHKINLKKYESKSNISQKGLNEFANITNLNNISNINNHNQNNNTNLENIDENLNYENMENLLTKLNSSEKDKENISTRRNLLSKKNTSNNSNHVRITSSTHATNVIKQSSSKNLESKICEFNTINFDSSNINKDRIQNSLISTKLKEIKFHNFLDDSSEFSEEDNFQNPQDNIKNNIVDYSSSNSETKFKRTDEETTRNYNFSITNSNNLNMINNFQTLPNSTKIRGFSYTNEMYGLENNKVKTGNISCEKKKLNSQFIYNDKIEEKNFLNIYETYNIKNNEDSYVKSTMEKNKDYRTINFNEYNILKKENILHRENLKKPIKTNLFKIYKLNKINSRNKILKHSQKDFIKNFKKENNIVNNKCNNFNTLDVSTKKNLIEKKNIFTLNSFKSKNRDDLENNRKSFNFQVSGNNHNKFASYFSTIDMNNRDFEKVILDRKENYTNFNLKYLQFNNEDFYYSKI